MSNHEVGQRVKLLREHKGLSRDKLGALAEVSAELIKKVETGQRSLTLRTAQRLAPVLGVDDLSQFYGPQVSLPMEIRPSHPQVPAVRKALTAWHLNVEGQPESADYLRGWVDSAWSTWHSSAQQRSETGANLPGLLDAAQRSARLAAGDERRKILAMLAQAYHLAQAYLAWHGERELVWLTVDRGMSAALDADDPLAIGSSSWYAAHLLRAVGHAEEALDHLAQARALVQRHMPESPAHEWPAMMADLWLCSALTKARSGDAGAWADWEQAKQVVDLLPADYVHPWTRVGPVLAEVQAVMLAVELGDAEEARRHAQNLDPESIPSVDRKARHLIELARGTNLEGSAEGTLHLLTQASHVSAETVAYTPPAREMVQKLVKSAGATSRREAEELARRTGIDI